VFVGIFHANAEHRAILQLPVFFPAKNDTPNNLAAAQTLFHPLTKHPQPPLFSFADGTLADAEFI
jgi:hypothetical protein